MHTGIYLPVMFPPPPVGMTISSSLSHEGHICNFIETNHWGETHGRQIKIAGRLSARIALTNNMYTD